MDDHAQQKSEKVYPSELGDVICRAGKGDLSALDELRRAYDEHPDLAAQIGDLVEHAMVALLDLIAGNNLTAKEAIRRNADEVKQRLAATAASPLERLLVDRVVICWLAVHQAELDVAAKCNGSGPTTQGDAQRRLDGASRRYLASIKALAVVQKLLKPTPSAFEMLSRPQADTSGVANLKNRGGVVSNGVPVCN